MQWTATPRTPVRFRLQPPFHEAAIVLLACILRGSGFVASNAAGAAHSVVLNAAGALLHLATALLAFSSSTFTSFFYAVITVAPIMLPVRPGGEIGRHKGLKIPRP